MAVSTATDHGAGGLPPPCPISSPRLCLGPVARKSAGHLRFPPVLLGRHLHLLGLLVPGAAHGHIEALHVLLQVHDHLRVRLPAAQRRGFMGASAAGWCSGSWQGALDQGHQAGSAGEGTGTGRGVSAGWRLQPAWPHSPPHKDVPDAARQVAQGAGLRQTAQLEAQLLLLEPLPAGALGCLRGLLKLVVHVQPDPAEGTGHIKGRRKLEPCG